MGIVKFGSRFKSRPKKTGARKRQRVKAQKRRLIAAGMDKGIVEKLGIKATRDYWKRVRRDA